MFHKLLFGIQSSKAISTIDGCSLMSMLVIVKITFMYVFESYDHANN